MRKNKCPLGKSILNISTSLPSVHDMSDDDDDEDDKYF